jgi:Family of unknown function (DUF695)/Regulator of ribonuclease activity B
VSSNWDFYLCQVENQPASMFVDLDIAAPIKGFAVMGYIRVFMNSPREDGLSSKEEFDILNQIEDSISQLVNEDALYVGRCTKDGCRDFIFYLKEADLWAERVGKILETFPHYEYETGAQDDMDWSVYLGYLSPSKIDRQTINNRRICSTLENHGDTLDQPRDLDHWAYFPDAQSRGAFIEKVSTLGFLIEKLIEPNDEYPEYGVQLKRSDVPNYHHIDQITQPLFHHAAEVGGEYNGWATYVIS